jgi:DNA-binding MarR family transcriptional regulator
MEKHPFYDMMLDLERDAQRPVTRVFRHVMVVARFFESVIEEAAAKCNLHPGEFLVLMTLDRSDAGMRSTEIYRSLLVTASAVTKRIDSLVSRGLVERISSETDRRSAKIRLTAEGRKIAATVRASPNAMHAVAERFGLDRIEELDRLLRDYLEAASDLTGSPA